MQQREAHDLERLHEDQGEDQEVVDDAGGRGEEGAFLAGARVVADVGGVCAGEEEVPRGDEEERGEKREG